MIINQLEGRHTRSPKARMHFYSKTFADEIINDFKGPKATPSQNMYSS